MSDLKYPWKRRWLSQGTALRNDSRGFLTCNEYSFGQRIKPKGFLLSELKDQKCIVLLGEPGLGKSTEIEKECKEIGEASLHVLSELIRLNSRSSEEGLIKLLDKKLASWQTRGGDLYLYLDGLDEGLLNLRNIFSLIIEWIEENNEVLGTVINRDDSDEKDESLTVGKMPLRLFFRLSCRSAIWLEEYTQQLKGLFRDEEVHIYELAPLEQEDVRVAAEKNEIDPESFIEAVTNAGLPYLASDPVSLNFLISAYRNGMLSPSQYDKAKVFHEGLLKLCEEINSSYKDQIQLSPKERLLLTSRIAVYSIFSNFPNILKPKEKYPDDKLTLLPDHVTGDYFKIYGEATMQFSLKFFDELTNTSVFTLGASEGQLSWKHRTYAEYLAAWHLLAINIPFEQIDQLITSAIDKKRVSPKFYEVVLWLASFKQEFFDEIVINEPLLMLRLHRKLTGVEQEVIVEQILRLATDKKLSLDYFADTRNFGKLCHSNLAAQVKPFIANNIANEFTLYIALSLAVSCRLTGLKDELIKILSDTSLSTSLRRLAMEALSYIDDSKIKEFLTSYVLKQHPDDVDDELKGQAIRSLYPQDLSTEDLFCSLTKPKKASLFGTYKAALSLIPQEVPENDLGVAMKNILHNDLFFEDHGYNEFGDIFKSIIKRAWSSVNLQEYLPLLTELIIKLKKNYINIDVIEDEKKRREVVFSIIKVWSKYEGDDPWLFNSPGNSLIQKDDWQWLSKIVRDKNLDMDFRVAAGEMLVPFRFNSNYEVIVALIDLANEVDWFGRRFKHELLKCDLRSIKSERDKRYLLRQRQNEQKQIEMKEKSLLSFSPIDKSLSELKSFEGGEINAWPGLLTYLRMGEDMQNQAHEFEMDIRKFPVWEKLSYENQERIVDAATRFLNDFNFPEDLVFYSYPILAGYKAKYLLYVLDKVDFIHKDTFLKWLPVVIYFNIRGFGQRTEVSDGLVRRSYKMAPSMFLKQLKKHLAGSNGMLHLERFEEVLKHGATDDFLSWLEDGLFNEEQRQSVLNTLAKYKPQALIERFESEVTNIQSAKFDFNKFADLSVEALNINVQLAWGQVWPFFVQDAKFGKTFLSKLVKKTYFKSSSISRLSPKAKADFLVWLYKYFPPENDREHDGAHYVNSIDYIANLRGQLLGDLIHHGTIEALQALQFFIQQLPEDTTKSRDWWLVEAKKNVIEKSYLPIEPNELRKILHNGQQRLVRSSQELLVVVLESLERLQKKLKGNNATSNFLWDKQKQKKGSKLDFIHKDENSFSDFVKMHLDYDLQGTGIIVNREVEIKKTTWTGTGERTDIFIQASNTNALGTAYTVVVEVKGCWHSELFTAMETQLVERYLAEWKSDCGVYLVGWFHGDNSKVERCHHKSYSTETDLEAFLDIQAKGLSTPRLTVNAMVVDCSLT